MLDFSIAENVTLPILPRLFPRCSSTPAKEREVANEYTAQLRRPDDRRRPAGRRAVGRQPAEGRARQVAGVEAARPDPRRADPRHRHRRQGRGPPDHLRAGRVRASAIILISSDLPEVLAMSDRILVLHEGRITAEIPRDRGDRGAGDVRGDRQRRGTDADGAGGSPAHAGPVRWLTPLAAPIADRPLGRRLARRPSRASASSASSRSCSCSARSSRSRRRSS